MGNKKSSTFFHEAESERLALLQMYQAGFIDGYNTHAPIFRKFDKGMKKLCIKAFNLRFIAKIQKEVAKQKNEKKVHNLSK